VIPPIIQVSQHVKTISKIMLRGAVLPKQQTIANIVTMDITQAKIVIGKAYGPIIQLVNLSLV